MATYLIGCSKLKDDEPGPVRGLYLGDLFRKSVTYAESYGEPWFVLSAKYGLLAPEDRIAPYDLTLLDMTETKQRAWGALVRTQLAQAGVARPLIALAGKTYRHALGLPEEELFAPLAGMPLGLQRRWLAANVRRAAA